MIRLVKWLLSATLLLSIMACAETSGPTGPVPYSSTGSQKQSPAPTMGKSAAANQPNAPEAGHPNVPEPSGDLIIGVLLPLSGPHAEIGKQLRDAALMGLYDKLNSLSSLQRTTNPRLIIKDTAGDEDRTTAMTQKLLAEGAKIILGPLLSEDVTAARKVAEKSGVPIIAFSNNPQVAGKNTYVFGFQSEEQVKRIASFALLQRIEHYAALSAQTPYGRTVVGQFSDIVKGGGSSLQPVNFFAEGQLPPAPVLERIVTEARKWGEARKGVFLPMTGQPLAAIATRLMSDEKINPAFLKLLGTGVWDDDEVLGIPAMQGAWFATSSPSQSRQFNKQFENTYGYRPNRLASLGYDAVALVTTLMLTEPKDPFSASVLLDRNGFSGPANGIFRFTPQGTVERALAVVEITPSGFQIIDPAPTGFQR